MWLMRFSVIQSKFLFCRIVLYHFFLFAFNLHWTESHSFSSFLGNLLDGNSFTFSLFSRSEEKTGKKKKYHVQLSIAQPESRPCVIARQPMRWYLRWLPEQRGACPSRWPRAVPLSSPAHRSMPRYACPSTRTIDVNRVTPRLQLGDMQLVSVQRLQQRFAREGEG